MSQAQQYSIKIIILYKLNFLKKLREEKKAYVNKWSVLY